MATPTQPDVQRIGKVERRFRELAESMGMEPGPLFKKLRDEGATQSDLAEMLHCTRQAIGTMSVRYGCPFPGSRLNIEGKVKELGYRGFDDYLARNDGYSHETMANELGVSLSTFRRRLRLVRKASNDNGKGKSAPAKDGGGKASKKKKK